MSWSLQIQNGDLVLSTHGMSIVTGANKLVQDLSCAILEPMGTDPLHPSYGSLIDGGVDTNGVSHVGVIGSLNDAATADLVDAEIQRIAAAYQQQQIARNASDVAFYGRSTLTADEALLNVGGITSQQADVNLMINVTLETGTGDQPLVLPITSS